MDNNWYTIEKSPKITHSNKDNVGGSKYSNELEVELSNGVKTTGKYEENLYGRFFHHNYNAALYEDNIHVVKWKYKN